VIVRARSLPLAADAQVVRRTRWSRGNQRSAIRRIRRPRDCGKRIDSRATSALLSKSPELAELRGCVLEEVRPT
jgi:hypothetical protein